MATIKGQNLRIFVQGKTIAAALECQLSAQMNVQELSTKDDEGGWTKNRVVSLSWSLTSNSVVTADDPNEDRNTAASLVDLIGQTVQVQFALASGDKNSEAGDLLMAGEAILSDAQITAQNRQRSTCQVTLTGKKNMIVSLAALVSADNHYLISADGHRLIAEHEA